MLRQKRRSPNFTAMLLIGLIFTLIFFFWGFFGGFVVYVCENSRHVRLDRQQEMNEWNDEEHDVSESSGCVRCLCHVNY